ncbi:short chain dehydrogenase [Phytophthora infestans]|uniref:Short chain dehydrogenase n=1 Tax=Phytophthora infestans TaxID=4787 RepID=A0A8S9VBK3_PHYIN|nr:short chain dehydrogenase [Phytophthora infestans]
MVPVPPGAKVWLVTGCASGLRREVVVAALAHGDCVIATARNPERLADLEKKGAWTLALDVTASQDELIAVVTHALGVYGTIDVLVNNAAYLLEGAIEECSEQESTTLTYSACCASCVLYCRICARNDRVL